MDKKLTILQIANKPPFPPMDGGAIGMNNITHELINQNYDVKVLAVNTHKHFVDERNLPKDYKARTHIEFGFIDTRIKPLSAALNLLTKRSYNIVRFNDKNFSSQLSGILNRNNYDIIIVETIFLKDYLPLIREKSKAIVILRAPNVEFKIWERLAEIEKNILKKWYLQVLAKRLKKEELEVVNNFDGLFTVTQNDREVFIKSGAKIPSTFIPTGLDVTKKHGIANAESTQLSLFHIGALDWMPNQEGIDWFLEHVWEEVSRQNPSLKFYIAGRRPTEELMKIRKKNVVILGEVEDAGAFIRKHSIMVVPLFSGSGMRVKIIEGMMLGRAIVSTSIGAEGIEIQPDRDIIIADTAKEFIGGINLLVKNSEKLKSMQQKAAESCRKNYSEEVISEKLDGFLKGILEEKN